jgi:hypothetical protein
LPLNLKRYWTARSTSRIDEDPDAWQLDDRQTRKRTADPHAEELVCLRVQFNNPWFAFRQLSEAMTKVCF